MREIPIEALRVTLPHLELDVKHLPDSTARFTELLADYIANPAGDVTGLRVGTLRDMAKSLKMQYERIDGLLSMLDKFEEGAGNEAL